MAVYRNPELLRLPARHAPSRTDLHTIIIVSGLPRSGTSLMMQMLFAGGVPIASDGTRPPDADNPRGYFELAAVKALARDSAWVLEHRGEALKVVAPLLKELPPGARYRVVFLERDLWEVLASQRAMLARLAPLDRPAAGGAPAADEPLFRAFERLLTETRSWLADQEGMETLFVEHRSLIEDPVAVAARLADFLELDLDLTAMAGVVSKQLYRQRRAQ